MYLLSEYIQITNSEIIAFNLLSNLNINRINFLNYVQDIILEDKYGVTEEYLLQYGSKVGKSLKNIKELYKILKEFDLIDVPPKNSKSGISLSKNGTNLISIINDFFEESSPYLPRSILNFLIFVKFPVKYFDYEDISRDLNIPTDWVRKSSNNFKAKGFIERYRKAGKNYTYVLTNSGKNLHKFYLDIVKLVHEIKIKEVNLDIDLLSLGMLSSPAINSLILLNYLHNHPQVTSSYRGTQSVLYLNWDKSKVLIDFLNNNNLIKKEDNTYFLSKQGANIKLKKINLENFLTIKEES